MTDWDHDVRFLEGAPQAFAVVNETHGYGFQFSVSSIDGTDLEGLLTQLYGTSYSTRKPSRERKAPISTRPTATSTPVPGSGIAPRAPMPDIPLSPKCARHRL